MKRVESDIYRPGDYVDAEKEALEAELHSTLGDRLDTMGASLERIESLLKNQEDAIQRLDTQYQALNQDLKKTTVAVKPEEIASSRPGKSEPTETENHRSKNRIASHNRKRDNDTQPRAAKESIPQNTISIPEDPETLYTKARSLLLENSLEEAEQLFRQFSKNFPAHPLAINSIYWTGECRYSLHDYQGAVDIFKGLIEKYPKGAKVPDALLKTAYAYLSMDDADRAHHYLKTVVKQYPFSSAGEKAEKKLKEFQ